MSEQTKACNLTKDEVHSLIGHHCCNITEETVSETMERLNYLHKRLKSFDEENAVMAEPVKSANDGWGNASA